MSRRRLLLLLAAAAVVVVVAGALGADAARSSSAHFTLRGTVVQVVDGDTIDIRLTGSQRKERVRLLGVDTPERGACYSANATGETRRLTFRKPVTLVGDRSQARRDRFGRLLAYVAAPGNRDVGKRLLERGFARVLVVGRPFQRVASYRASQRGAQSTSVGLWSACASSPPPPSSPPSRADLSVSISPSTATATFGQDVTYTATITNGGPGVAQQTSAIMNLPGVTPVAMTPSQGACGTVPVVSCTFGSLAASTSVAVTIVVRTVQHGAFANTITVSSQTADPNSADNSASVTLSVAGPPPPQPPPPGPGPDCHPSYPDFCVPPPPPDLDCANFAQRRFRVRYDVPNPDPHRLDGDRDGIACES